MIKIIAELCQNHNGNPENVFSLLEAAVRSGATHVKLQHIFSENLTFRAEFENGHLNPVNNQRIIKRPYTQEFERLKGLELAEGVVSEFISECRNLGVVPLTTCFCTEHAEPLARLGFEEIKIASYDCASPFLLKAVSECFNWIYVSTGATFDSEIQNAIETLEDSYSLLHCVTRYPTPLKYLNLSRIKYLEELSGRPTGYSDHSLTEDLGIWPCILAMANDAKILERHFTIYHADETRDGRVSATPEILSSITELSTWSTQQLKAYIEKNCPFNPILAQGDDEYLMSDEEYSNRLYYRGRFASVKTENGIKRHVYNWESY